MKDTLKQVLTTDNSTEEELKLKLAELTDFVENAALPLHWVNGEGIIIWANQAELDSLGYTKEEYIGQPISKFHADEVVISDILDRLIGNQTLTNYSARLRCKDGSIKNVLINSNVLWQDGKFVHTRCFTRDITDIVKEQERKAALLSQLEESEQRLRMAIESTKLGTWDFNPVTGELNWSEECRKIYGLAAGVPLTFETFAAHIHPEDRRFVQEKIKESMQWGSGGMYDITYRIIRFDDTTTRWIRAQGKVYHDEAGTAVRFIGTVVDITESKLAEEKNARLAAIIESSDDAIISKTLDGIVTSWNKSAQRMYGYTEEEMLGHPIIKLIPEERRAEEQGILARLKGGEHVEHFETKRITKEQKIIDVSLTASAVRDSQGDIIGLSKIIRDITEKKQEEQRKNDFIGMVSHELKTPLTSLTAIVQMANAKLKNNEDTFLSGAMDKAVLQVKKMANMINGFLNVSRFESGKIAIAKQHFDMLELLKEVIDETGLTVSTHTITLFPCGAVQLFADRDKIGSVISNLLSNAIKYSPKGKNIEVTCKMPDGGHLEISVKDEGIGIKPQDTAKLFGRYYRVQTTHSKHISGFGIGLYLCAEIIKQHDGKIWVESKSGVGSTFYFSLPVGIGK